MSIRAIVVDNSEELLEKITRILREMEDVELCGSFDSICEGESGGYRIF